MGSYEISPKQAEICRHWEKHGYYVLRGAIDIYITARR